MINPSVYEFLKELKDNNNREWFQENRKRYEEARQNFIHILEILIHEIGQFDHSIKGQLPKDSLFRINRDVRFSKDKSPYKTNIGAFITPKGRNGGYAGYYVHLEPDNSFLAGGIYMPPSPLLKAIRQEIFENLDEFKSIVEHAEFKNHFGEKLYGEKLKTRPKGFPEDFIGLEYLRFKHYTVAKMVKDNYVTDGDFIKNAIDTFRQLYPFNRFLNYVVANMENPSS